MRLLALPPEWRAAVVRHVETMLHPNGTKTSERTTLEAQKKRLVRLYADGLTTETEYAAEARTVQELMATLESPFVEELDLRAAAALLADMPTLLAASPIPEQRGILRGIFDRVWVAAHTISAIMPNRLFLPLASATMTRTIFCHRPGTISCPKIRHLCIIIVNLASITGTIFCQKVKIRGHILSESYGLI